MIEIREATKSQAAEIARLIMMAMTTDCCLYFCGEVLDVDCDTGGYNLQVAFCTGFAAGQRAAAAAL